MGLLSGGGGRMLSAGFISARRGALPSTESELGGWGCQRSVIGRLQEHESCFLLTRKLSHTPSLSRPRDSEAHLPPFGAALSDPISRLGSRLKKFLFIVNFIQKFPKPSLVL